MKFSVVTYRDTRDLATRHPLAMSMSHLLFDNKYQNPFIDDDFPVLCYMHDGAELASYFLSFPDRLYFDDEIYKWAWCGNLFTDPKFRGQGVAAALVRQQAELFHGLDLAWGGVFSTPAALRIYEKLGFSVLGYARRFLILKNISPFLSHHVSNKRLADTAQHLYRAGATLMHALVHSGRVLRKNCVIKSIDKFSCPSVSEAINGIVHTQRFHFDNSPKMLVWKRQARNIDQLYIVRSLHTGEKLFYLLVRDRVIREKALLGKYKDFNLMTIMDFGQFSSAPSIGKLLIAAILKLFYESSADACELITSDHGIATRARMAGMFNAGLGMSFTYSLPTNWNLGADRSNLCNWSLTHYHGDAFSFE